MNAVIPLCQLWALVDQQLKHRDLALKVLSRKKKVSSQPGIDVLQGMRKG
jgi:hypothetical protein